MLGLGQVGVLTLKKEDTLFEGSLLLDMCLQMLPRLGFNLNLYFLIP